MPAITFDYEGKYYRAFYYRVDLNNARIESYSVEIIDNNFNNGIPSPPYTVAYYVTSKDWVHRPENSIGDALEKAVIKHIGGRK
jgi:hypothetical protein